MKPPERACFGCEPMGLTQPSGPTSSRVPKEYSMRAPMIGPCHSRPLGAIHARCLARMRIWTAEQAEPNEAWKPQLRPSPPGRHGPSTVIRMRYDE